MGMQQTMQEVFLPGHLSSGAPSNRSQMKVNGPQPSPTTNGEMLIYRRRYATNLSLFSV